MKKGSKKSLLVVALLLLVGVTAYFGANTYAKYASEITGNKGTATVAKWAFATDNEAKTFTVDLAKTYDANTLVGGKIAPGTEGSFKINLNTKNTETGVAYTVKLSDLENVPTNLKFYKNEGHTEALDANGSVTGTLAPNDATGTDVTIYWAWAFGNNDVVTDTVNEADTTDGVNAKTLTIGLDVVGIQVQPE